MKDKFCIAVFRKPGKERNEINDIRIKIGSEQKFRDAINQIASLSLALEVAELNPQSRGNKNFWPDYLESPVPLVKEILSCLYVEDKPLIRIQPRNSLKAMLSGKWETLYHYFKMNKYWPNFESLESANKFQGEFLEALSKAVEVTDVLYVTLSPYDLNQSRKEIYKGLNVHLKPETKSQQKLIMAGKLSELLGLIETYNEDFPYLNEKDYLRQTMRNSINSKD